VVTVVVLVIWTPAVVLYLSFENACSPVGGFPIPAMSC
jgi:hypothetical protein